MTIQQIAQHYYELAQQQKWSEIIDTYYHDDIECIEPANSKSQPYTKGKANVIAKAMHFQQMIETIHNGYTTHPIIAGDMFSVGMGMDFTMKGAGRMQFDEFGVFTVKDGKIVREEFIMNWSKGGGHDYNETAQQ